jgi:DNA-directed RNA polymerase specialized sigma24 family protein
METMPAKLAEVLILAYFHRFSYKDIAEVVGAADLKYVR